MIGSYIYVEVLSLSYTFFTQKNNISMRTTRDPRLIVWNFYRSDISARPERPIMIVYTVRSKHRKGDSQAESIARS